MNQGQPRTHKDLELWQEAMSLAVQVHFVTNGMPRQETFGLTSQMRRAAVSVPSNIAEGAARRTTRDFNAFLHVSRGSLAELETQLLLARQIGYLPNEAIAPVLDRLASVGRLLSSVIASLRRRQGATVAPSPRR